MQGREAIMTALFALLESAAGFRTAARRVKLWDAVPAADKPALFLTERGDDYLPRKGNAQPAIVTMSVDVMLYTDAGKDPTVTPSTALNTLIDAVEAALAPSPASGMQTLGGLVSHCWIEGKILKDPGDLDGYGVAVIPVNILATV